MIIFFQDNLNFMKIERILSKEQYINMESVSELDPDNVAEWDIESDDILMERFNSLKEAEFRGYNFCDDELQFYIYMGNRKGEIKRKQRQTKLERKKEKEAKRSVKIQVPEGMSVSHCPEHGWFAGKVVYTSFYNGKEVNNINISHSILHWEMRCPLGCFITGGRGNPITTISELKTREKTTVAVPRT